MQLAILSMTTAQERLPPKVKKDCKTSLKQLAHEYTSAKKTKLMQITSPNKITLKLQLQP